jgi:hypothetical protein
MERNHISIGAYSKGTKEYIYPYIANKTDEYSCPECNRDVIFCKGEIVRPYFRHKAIHGDDSCVRYDNPTESQIHKDAKMLLKTILETKGLSVRRPCIRCSEIEEYDIKLDATNKVIIECPFGYNNEKKIADVAVIIPEDDDISSVKDENLICIFEIYNTHKTKEENRPDPWFELDALQFIETINKGELTVSCIRSLMCDDCVVIENNYIIKCCGELDIHGSLNDIINSPYFTKYIRYKLGQQHFVNLKKDERPPHRRFDFHSYKYEELVLENNSIINTFSSLFGNKKVNISSYKGQLTCTIKTQNDICGEYDYAGIGTIDIIASIFKKINKMNIRKIRLSRKEILKRSNRKYFNIPYASKDEFKKYGGQFDSSLKLWFVDNNILSDINKKWYVGGPLAGAVVKNSDIGYEISKKWKHLRVDIEFIERYPCRACNDTGRAYLGGGAFGDCIICDA